MKRITLALLGVFLCSAPTQSVGSAQQLTGAQRNELEKDLERVLLNKRVKAKATFPAWKDGIDLKTDGSWDNKWTTRQIKDHGVGIEVDEAASVTAVKLREKQIEIHLNGGGAGTFGDTLLTSDAKKQARESSGGKAPGGSRINLKFDRPITKDDVADLARLSTYLEPLVDVSSLRQEASRQSIPEEFRSAAAKGLIVEGMDKATVFAISGEPKNKNVDISGDAPIEKWQYELTNLKTRIVTFRAGKVSKVDEF